MVAREIPSELERFKQSPEHEDWITETGGRDEDFDEYWEAWLRRTRN